MIEIPLAVLPNQSLTVQLDNTTYSFVIQTTNTGVMVCDLIINGVVILSGQRLVANFPIIPYVYLENGNFAITSMDDELPDYTQFGTTQFLIYASTAELAALRAGS